MKSKKELLELIDELKYADVFNELDKLNLNSEAYNRLKKEFVLGKADIDFNDRLKIVIDLSKTTSSQKIFFKSKNKIILLIIVISLIVSISYFNRGTITGIYGNNNSDNQIIIADEVDKIEHTNTNVYGISYKKVAEQSIINYIELGTTIDFIRQEFGDPKERNYWELKNIKFRISGDNNGITSIEYILKKMIQPNLIYLTFLILTVQIYQCMVLLLLET